jgi:hypothetical protein
MNQLPVWIDRAEAALTFAIGIYLVAVHALLSAMAATRAGLSSRARAVAPFAIGAFLAVWFAVALVAGDAKNFAVPRGAVRPLSVLVGFGPVIAAAVLLYRNRTLRAINDAMPSDWLIRAQMYRMAGIMFLYPSLYYGVLPAGFAIPAAVGDFLTGFAAPWVAASVARKRPGSLALATAWNFFGIADLLVAPVAAVLTQAQVLYLYPLALVPLFIGPPMGILAHVYSLRNLARASSATQRDLRAVGTIGAA